MTAIRYIDKGFYRRKAELLPHVQAVIQEYADAGYRLNPRGVAYRLEGRGVITKTTENFQCVEDIVSDGREMGLIDWEAIELDGKRGFHEPASWKSATDHLSEAADDYRLDKWANQPRRVLVVTEKAGLRGILEPAADEYDVPVRSTGGYDSVGSVRSTAIRIMRYSAIGRLREIVHRSTGNGTVMPYALDEWLPRLQQRSTRKVADWITDGPDQRAVILYVGDHDPSGCDVDRDLHDKLDRYGAEGLYVLKRIAVTCEETCEAVSSGLHSNPAKESDKRHKGYVLEHGTDQSWEVESIEPAALAGRLRAAIVREMEADQWNADLDAEERDRDRIRDLAERFGRAS